MNKNESKFNFKTFITFLTVLVLTLSLAFATACKKNSSSESESDSSSESESVESPVDEQTLKNGDFEFTSGKNTTKPNTATSWTVRSDGADNGFSTGTSSSYVLIDTEDSAFETLLSEYKYSTDEVVEGETKTTYHNPRTPFYNDEAEDKGLVDDENTEINEAGTKVMMLRNTDYSAQYATSSTTLTVPAGEYAVVSIWVMTYGIEGKLGKTDVGAYIQLKHNVVDVNNDDTAYDPLLIKNINTNGKWTKFVIYLEPNQSKTTSYTLVLGLGQGNVVNTANHAKGFAFFDGAEFSLIKVADLPQTQPDGLASPNSSTIDVSADNSKLADGVFVSAFTLKTRTASNFDFATGSTHTWNAVNPNTQDNAVKQDDTKVTTANGELKIDFTGFGNIGSSYTHSTNTLTLNPQNYVRISFLVKVTTKEYQTGATLAIYDTIKGEVVASFDNVNTNDYENENTDNFARYTFYVANNFVNSGDVMSYQLRLTYGPTEKVTSANVLPTGEAIFKDFEIEEDLSKEEFDAADVTSDTRAKKVTLTGDYQNDYVEDEDDDDDTTVEDYFVTANGMNKVLVENGELLPIGEILRSTLSTDAPNGVLGLANSKYVANTDAKAALDFLASKNDNNPVQALVLVSNGTEYYLAGKTITIPENTTYKFSVKVYVHSGNAFVRLVDVNQISENDKHVVFKANDTNLVKTTITNADCTRFEDGYAIVTYVITTGNETLKLKLEFGGNGVAVFDEFDCGSLDTAHPSAEKLIEEFDDGLNNNDAVYTFTKTEVVPQIYYYASEDDVGQEDLRLKDDDGKLRVKDGEKTTIVALGGANADATEYFVQYYRFDTDDLYEIDAGDEEEDTNDSESESESESESTTEVENYGWLQVTSIIIALVLVGVLIAVVVRKSLEGKMSKKKKTQNYYQGYDKSTRRTGKNDVVVPDAEDNAKDYDYDNPENN